MSVLFSSSAAEPESIDTSFIKDAVSQLLMSRRVLRASYGYGFFLVGSKDKKTLSYEQDRKTMFELMQVLFCSSPLNLSINPFSPTQ